MRPIYPPHRKPSLDGWRQRMTMNSRMENRMKRLGWILMLSAVPCLTGCTGGSSASKEKPESASTQTAKGEAITPASEVVAQFLDSFRRGDETTAGKLLTQAAIAEIKRCNLELAPPGSPESSFEIGKTAYEDDAKDTAWSQPFGPNRSKAPKRNAAMKRSSVSDSKTVLGASLAS